MRALTTPARPPAGQDLPVDPATLHPEDDGFFGRRAKARRAKLLGGISDVLRRALGAGETVRYVARGVRYHLLEHVFGGSAVAQYQNMTALVVTDRRLLLLQLDRRGRAGDIKNEVPFAAIQGARSRGFRLRLQLADGTKLSFVHVPGRDRKRLVALLPAAPGPRSSEPSLVHLCPACLRPVPGAAGTTLVCPAQDCRIPFRDPRRAARLSMLVPGLGDLYLRHHFFGALEFLGSMAMLGVAVALVAQAAAGDGATLAAAAVIAALLVTVPRAIDYRLTLHMGHKGLVPLALAPAPGAQARNLPSYPRWSPLLFAAGLALAGGVVLLVARDLGADAAVREASTCAAQGRLDEARARWQKIEQEGRAGEAHRVRFALALLQAGDLEGAEEVQRRFEGAKIDAALAARWNAALEREQGALADYRRGVEALVRGDASAWGHLDRAIAYFRGVKRPHLPQSRGEVQAHLAERVLREPIAPADLESARRWLEGLGDAPPAEAAAIRAAFHSATRNGPEAAAALAAAEAGQAPVPFRLLALEARARLARTDADRAAVRSAAEVLRGGALDDDDEERLTAIVAQAR